MITEFNNTVFEIFPEMETKRLKLREIRESDLTQIFEIRREPRVNQFIARDVIKTESEALEIIHKVKASFHEKQGIGWAVTLKDEDKLIGTFGYNMLDKPNYHAEIGGELNIAYWGTRIAEEATRAIIDFGLKQLALHTIEAKVSPDNRGVIYLLTKLGFIKEAHYSQRVYHKGYFQDMAVYSLITDKVQINN